MAKEKLYSLEDGDKKINLLIDDSNYDRVMAYLEAKCKEVHGRLEEGVFVIDDSRKLHYSGLMSRLGMGVLEKEEFDALVKEAESASKK